MTPHATTHSIEAQIELDRSKLSATLDALQDRVSIDSLTRDALGMLRANTESYTRAIDQAVRANPLAVGLVGVGLAWLVFGGRKAVSSDKVKHEPLSTWEDDGGPARASDEHEESWSLETDTLRKRATATLKRLEAEARVATQGVRDFAAERAAVVAEFTNGLQQNLRHGLEDLSVVAQDRIVAAREAAYAARIKLERVGMFGPRDVGRMIDDHPMVTGAVMMALGAALGAALPRTDIEDRTFGGERDRLMQHAARLLDEERAQMTRIASDIGNDLADSARDALGYVAESVVDAGDKVKGQIQRATESV